MDEKMTPPKNTSPGISGCSYGSLAALLIIAITLFRLWFCTRLELVGDEGYYWLCSRHLDLSFFDKGPGAAATIALGTRLFGNTVFGVRFFAVMLSMGTGIAVYGLAKMLFSAQVAFRSLVMALVIPMFAVGSILMTIDPLSVFFWTVSAIFFWKAVNDYGVLWWIGAGSMIGLGMLAKYTNLAELICYLIFCAWTPGHRKHLLRPWFYLMILCALAFSLPVFIWNARHDWITVGHLLHRGAVNSHWRINPAELLAFLGQQAGVISPLIFCGILTAVFGPGLSRTASDQTRFLASLFLPLFVFYSILSLNKAGQANWAAPSYVSGIVLLAAKWEDFERAVKGIRWTRKGAMLAVFAGGLLIFAGLFTATFAKGISPLFTPGTRLIAAGAASVFLLALFTSFFKWPVGVAIGLALLETIVMHDTYWLHLPKGRDPLDRVRGGASVALRASELADEYGADFFISNKYADAGLLAFYLPGHPDTFMPDSPNVDNQFSIWPGYLKRFKAGATGLFVADGNKIPEVLKREFSQVSPAGEFESTYRDRKLKKIYFFLCRDLHNGASQP